LSNFIINEIIYLLNNDYISAEIIQIIDYYLITVYQIQQNLHCFKTARISYSIYKVKLKIISEILSELKNFIK
ncbi:hypothetical protein EMPG_13032, partial [Blastomyces silverae]